MMSESTLPPTPLASLQTIGQARAELEARLVSIHNDLQLTQSIGLLFVKRQEDLRNCFDQLQELKDLDNHQQQLYEGSDYGSGSESTTQQPLPEELREQLALIDKEFQDSQHGILGLKGLIDAQLPTIEIQPPQNDSRSTSVLGPSALPSSALPAQTITKPRRHKVVVNSAPSINDPAFPVQIQEELLNQVRYWTSQAEMKEKLNQEYDTKITEMERIIDALNKQRRMREESDERQKEDQWNLELMNQELRSQNADLQSQLSRTVHENSKIQKALAVASEQSEQLKDKEERTAGQLELAKSRHEQDMMTMRKHTAGIQREKADLAKKIEELQATISQQQQKLTKKATMEAVALAQEKERQEQELESPVEAPIVIQAPPRLPTNDEIAPAPVAVAPAAPEPKTVSLARETSFAHQQSIISDLQSKLSLEIAAKEQLLAAKEELLAEKEELAKMLADHEETIETMRMEGTMGGFEHPAAPAAPAAPEPKATSLARETSFAHKKSLISDLQSKLSLEITEKEQLLAAKDELLAEKEGLLAEKEELARLLADREETIETMKMEATVEHPAESVAPAAPEPKAVSLADETSFAHDQSIISELESKLSLEIAAKEQLIASKEELLAEKEELVKLLADREETIETMRMEGTMGGLERPAESAAPAAPEPKAVSLADETSFAHDQSIISELESKLSLEIAAKEQLIASKEELLAEKEELAKLLADREETIETMRMEATVEHPAESVAPAAPEPKAVSLADETSFAHDQSIISELESKLSLEITAKEQLLAAKEELLAEKEELARLLADREETIETMRMEHPAAAVAQVSDFNQGSLGASEIENGDLGFESHKEISNGLPVLRPVSSMYAGGLFAELAQASSSVEPVKPVIECKDQEAMTEPIESWIHTIPGLVLAPASTSASVSESKPAVGAATAGVAAATAAVAAAAVVAEKIVIEKNTIATNTETKSLVDGATSMEPKTLVDGATSMEPKTLVDSAASTDSKSLADGTTSTEDLPAPVAPTVESVSPKVMADDATSTEDLPVTVVPLIEKEAPQAKTLVDSTTSTDDLPVLAAPAVEAVTPQEPAQPTKTLVDSATSTDDLPIVAAIPQLTSQRNEHLANTITGKTGEIAHAYLPEASTVAQDIAQVEVQDPTFSEDFGVSRKISKAPREINSHRLDATEPIPRTSQSDIPIGDERRHTCDMSQILVDTPSQSAPPVPALPKNIARLQLQEDTDNEGQEFRVSFGSAFGGPSGGLMTGRIEPVESSEQHYAGGNDEEAQRSEIPSPGRPATGPPSNLLARAARASMASILENGMPNDRPESVYNAHMSSISAVGGAGSYAYPPTSYPQRTTSIRTPSIKSEKMFSSSPPTHQSRNAGTTGAAVISGTTRMAYTFGNSSSQVHIPQQPTYQHITDSSGASIGRSKHRPSPSGSVSSLSTDYHHERRGSIGSSYDAPPTATDPTMIQIITQTMIGDYLWKYTRRPMASVISEKKHRRYFWVHPYTKTMYWSLTNPAADGSREQRAKSALIINVYQITEENPSGHSDLPNVSLLVQTTNRNLKLTAPTREKHELWYQSLAYLLSRPTTPGAEISTDNQTWSEIQASRGVTSDALLTIKNDKAVRKKASFGRLHTMFGRSKESSPASSPRPANAATGPGLNSTITAASFNYSSVGVNGPPTSGSGVVGYPNHIINNPSQSGVGGYGTVNGGRIMPQQGTSSLGTNTSPKSGLTSGRGYEDEYYDGEDDEDEDDGELPEHVRQCCDGKHDIGSLHHDH